MTPRELQKVVQTLQCRIIDWEEASNDSHREVLAIIGQAFDHDQAVILCEPSLAKGSRRPPDICLIDPIAGVQIIEVKGVSLDQIEAIDPGGQMHFHYSSGVRRRNVVAQVRNAMFDVMDATARSYAGHLELPFNYWIAMPRIDRQSWENRWGENGHCPKELLFNEDLLSSDLADRIREHGRTSLDGSGRKRWASDQLNAVFAAFGDSSVLYPAEEERPARKTKETTLGAMFDEAAESYKALSDEQQLLSAQNWEGGPRLVRGVAGSGKTIVLANNVARRIQRSLGDEEELFTEARSLPRVLAVCFNRTLVPFIRKKIDLAFRQRTGQPLPEECVEVYYLNQLMYHLSQVGLWRYQQVKSADDHERAAQYLHELRDLRERHPDIYEVATYDAIYVDEGQDLDESEILLLKELCRIDKSGEPNLYIFYDDAQNLYARSRPNWRSLGLNVTGGRASVMTQCFRNTREIIEPSFNVLYGRYSDQQGRQGPTKQYGDIEGLLNRGDIEDVGGRWRVHFAKRHGTPPIVTFTGNISSEDAAIVERLRWLICQQEVRPEDVQILTLSRKRAFWIAKAVEQASIKGLSGVHVSLEDRDDLIIQRGQVCVSTVASAKGYDSYCVLMASADKFPETPEGRATFYVGCTRAIEYLEVLAVSETGLAAEMYRAVNSQKA